MPQGRTPDNPFRSLAAFSALAICLGILMSSSTQAADEADFSVRSENGRYTAEIYLDRPIEINRFHSWLIDVRTEAGQSFVPSQLVIYGGMPKHRHGLPKQPLVTEKTSAGFYKVEGLFFDMYGLWDVVIGLTGPNGPDKLLLNLKIEPLRASPTTVPAGWSDLEWRIVESLAIAAARGGRRDTSNRFDHDSTASKLGEALFFDTKLSKNGDISCATCHQPELYFTDGLRLSKGSAELSRNSPSIVGVSHSRWFYWDGRRDSLWAQALTPIETPGEMDNTRTAVVKYVVQHKNYAPLYEEMTGGLPDIGGFPDSAGPFGSSTEKNAWQELPASSRDAINRAFSNVGKFIASYVSTIEPLPSRFDKYVNALRNSDVEAANEYLSPNEIAGLRLFINDSKTACLRCHNGSYFTNFGFHNLGTGVGANGLRDFGRLMGIRAARIDVFNCVGRYSDADPSDCPDPRFEYSSHGDDGAFKVPSLRNVARTGPYMHDGRFDTLDQVIEFYRDPAGAMETGHELPSLELSAAEQQQLIAFLAALSDDRE